MNNLVKRFLWSYEETMYGVFVIVVIFTKLGGGKKGGGEVLHSSYERESHKMGDQCLWGSLSLLTQCTRLSNI